MNLKLSIVNYQLSILLLLFFTLPLKAQVTIGVQKAPHSYSVLELTSTKGGLRLPMLNTSERDALKLTPDSTEASGLVIYNTDIDCAELFSNGSWIDLCSSALPLAKLNPATIATLVQGSGALNGRTLFDIVETIGGTSSCGTVADRAANKADFSTTAAYDYIFTASATGTVQNIRYVIQDSEGVLQSSQSLSGTLVLGTLANGTSAPALTLNFKTDLNSASSVPLIIGRDRSSAAHVIINIVYNNGSTDVKVPLTLAIQDCAGCGAYVSATSWKEFMCYNLGADPLADPFTPSQALIGDYYQWGSKTPVAYGPNNGNAIVGTWSSITPATVYGDGSTSETVTTKSSTDPCLSGYRVPNLSEWKGVINTTLNPQTLKGTWSADNWNGYMFGNSLFLPAEGNRYSRDGALTNYRINGYYWGAPSGSATSACGMYFTSSNINTTNNTRTFGFNIRCIAE